MIDSTPHSTTSSLDMPTSRYARLRFGVVSPICIYNIEIRQTTCKCRNNSLTHCLLKVPKFRIKSLPPSTHPSPLILRSVLQHQHQLHPVGASFRCRSHEKCPTLFFPCMNLGV